MPSTGPSGEVRKTFAELWPLAPERPLTRGNKQKLLFTVLFVPLLAFAARGHGADDIKKDVQRHREMAAAHAAAAKCLESGKTAEVCQRELQGACKGLAIGKYCGMKHAH